jgi:hypothetical protein
MKISPHYKWCVQRHFGLAATAASMATIGLSLPAAKAQYPNISAEVKAEADAKKTAADQRSDVAWEKALPAVKEWESKGKPYIPWAEKPDQLPSAKIPAFPGAQGGGLYSFGGRGGKVFVVTNLNDSGPGSFREALETGGPRIVVFNVAGVIQLKDRIRVRAPYITIAGNTAPGDGVCIAGDTVELETHDVIIRYMRFRRGNTWVGDRNDSLGGNPIGNVMIDHVSASWGLDECLSMYRHMYQPPGGGSELKLPTVNITIQNTLFSEALNTYNHAFGGTLGGLNSTFHHNIFACNAGRNPSVGMYGDFTFVNNVLFNWVHRTVDGGDQRSFFNIINNYFKPGPATPKGQPIAYRLVKPESERSKTVVDNFGKAYVNGNVVEGNESVTKDNWDGGVQPEVKSEALDEALKKIRVDEPFAHAPLNIQSASEAYAYNLANVGANLPKRDPVDARVLETVRTGAVNTKTGTDGAADFSKVGYKQEVIDRILADVPKGIITNPSQVGGYPEYKGEPYKDSDGDGLPDEWELEHGLNPKDSADAAGDLNGDGYTNIEKYIDGLNLKAPKTDWTDLKNNVDPRNAALGIPLKQP